MNKFAETQGPCAEFCFALFSKVYVAEAKSAANSICCKNRTPPSRSYINFPLIDLYLVVHRFGYRSSAVLEAHYTQYY